MSKSPSAASPVLSSSLVETLDRALAWHQELRATIARLDAAFKRWEVSPRLAAPWRHFTEGMDDHLRVEEEVLFPALRALAEARDPGRTDFESPLQEMQFEIDEIATISEALRSASPEARELEQTLLDMLDHLDLHAEKEQEVIFPEAARLLAAWKTSRLDEPKPPPRPAPTWTPSSERTADEAARFEPDAESGVLFRVLRRFAKIMA